jgi:hypothetical protein
LITFFCPTIIVNLLLSDGADKKQAINAELHRQKLSKTSSAVVLSHHRFPLLFGALPSTEKHSMAAIVGSGNNSNEQQRRAAGR